MILSNEIGSQLSRVWVRLTEPEKQILKYLAKQEKAVTLMEILQIMSDDYNTEIILNSIRSLKRRYFLEDDQNGVGASHAERHRSPLLKLDQTLEAYVRSLKN